MSIKHDRLDSRQNRKDSSINISLVLESPSTSKIQKKEKINEIYFDLSNMLYAD